MAPKAWILFTIVTLIVCVNHVSSQRGTTSCRDPCATRRCAPGFVCVSEQVTCVRAPCCPIANCVRTGGGRNKPGSCPRLEPGTVGPCIEACRSDRDCRGNLKCCSNGCGRVCTNPRL